MQQPNTAYCLKETAPHLTLAGQMVLRDNDDDVSSEVHTLSNVLRHGFITLTGPADYRCKPNTVTCLASLLALRNLRGFSRLDQLSDQIEFLARCVAGGRNCWQTGL